MSSYSRFFMLGCLLCLITVACTTTEVEPQITSTITVDVVEPTPVPSTPTPPPLSPSPTPPPLTSEPAQVEEAVGFLIYIQNGRLVGAPIDMSQTPPQFGETTLMSDSVGVQSLDISPDGQFIAYTVGDFSQGSNSLHILDGDGTDILALTSESLPFVPEATELGFGDAEDPNLFTRIYDFQWLNDSRTIAFSTGIANTAGFSPGAHSDLWTFDIVNSELTERFPAGTGAPVYAISPFNNQVIFATRKTMFRANIDGSERQELTYYDPIDVLESFYYPAIQWNDAGTIAYVTISHPIQQKEGNPPDSQAASLIFLPVDGPPGDINPIYNHDIFYPPIWSGDGEHLAYVSFAGDGYNLMIADGMLQEQALHTYTTGQHIFHSWSPDGNHFVYSDNEGYYLDGFDDLGFSVDLNQGERILDVQWLNNDYFLTAVTVTEGGWLLDFVPVGDEPITNLGASDDGFGEFELWYP